MTRRRPVLIRRNAALTKTIEKYRGKPFVWGKSDCMKMVRSHLVAMGHKKLPKVPHYSNAIGAKRALRECGAETVEQMLDSLKLPRIAPAAMLPGDIALLRGTEGFQCAMISTGFKLAGWAEEADEFVTNFMPREIVAAYRV